MLVPSDGLRQGFLDRRRSGLRRNLSRRWFARRRRTVTLRQRRPRLVLLFGAGGREYRTQDGLLSDHRDDESAPPTEHGILRPPLSQPGHPTPRRVRQPHRAPTPAWPPAGG